MSKSKIIKQKLRPEAPAAPTVPAAVPTLPAGPAQAVRANFAQVTFARKLDQAMKRKNLNQSELAAAIWGTRESMINGKVYTVSRNRDRISVFLQAKGYPRPQALEKMAFILDVKPQELCPEVTVKGQEKLPPEVAFTLIEGRQPGQQIAALRVNTIVSATLALKIATLIQKEHDDAKAA